MGGSGSLGVGGRFLRPLITKPPPHLNYREAGEKTAGPTGAAPCPQATGPRSCGCWCSVAESCPILCEPMDRTPGLPAPHHPPEFAQVHSVSEVIQPPRPLPSSPSAFNLSQSGSSPMSWLFKWLKKSEFPLIFRPIIFPTRGHQTTSGLRVLKESPQTRGC